MEDNNELRSTHAAIKQHADKINVHNQHAEIHQIEEEEIEAIQGRDDGYEEENFNLVAKVLCKKELNFKTIKASLMGMWGQPEGVAITEVGRNQVLISFQNRSKGFQVWRGGHWSIKGNLFNMHVSEKLTYGFKCMESPSHA
ncbi:hypothetical protein PIB30_003566 [Stylosanthes scabra]|uniref:DUF4283 domain-containing protein n=1 Tax=Stylosanthes scabra TaxID=79078 RepID=A0ABU6X577_9FABA|nr:hypothetical protein [Stylosanthes scabra]